MPYASPTLTSTYEGLCTAIADTLNRADLTTGIPNFVALATARIQRDMPRSRHPSAITRAQASVSFNYAPLPLDFIAVYQLLDQNTSLSIDYMSPDQTREILSQGYNGTTSSTKPVIFYTIVGNTLRIIPAPGATAPTTLDLWYYATLPALNTSNTTNWVLTKYPDLYLYGSLVHSAPYLKADERIALWETSYQTILRDIEVEAERATRSQSRLTAARRSF
jgi:hypothetical protein